ncbi:restriction endonuclease subunit S [Joostella sp. CR20]|uniref:restriction endonuclease subunit S n=1 Tax=Joostella sp. CR20 TaxID=2804312 RepID=UPI00313BED4D
MSSNYKKLGDYIRPLNERNRDLQVKTLLGVSIQKILMPSIANTVGTNMKTYKVIKKNQFAYGPVTSRNGDKISIALLQEFDEAIISQAYTVFEVIDISKLHPEYLMMWFRRPEFDRYARFKSHGSARETFDWDEMCEVELPIPSIEKQQEIVNEYNTVTNRIKLNEQLNQKLEETAQALYKHWFVDFEFPNEEGKPYKSSGGEMVFNEELDKEIPVGWEFSYLGNYSTIKGGKRMPSGSKLIKEQTDSVYIKVADLGTSKYVQLDNTFEYVPSEVAPKISRYITHKDDVVISIVGTIGVVKIVGESLNGANLTENCMKITKLKRITSSYLYHYLVSKEGKEEIKIRNVGAVQAKLPMYNLESFPIVIPKAEIINEFENKVISIDKVLNERNIESKTLTKLQSVLLSKMSKVKERTPKEVNNEI